MKKFFFGCEVRLRTDTAGTGPTFMTPVQEVTQTDEDSARIALSAKLEWEFPTLVLVKAELLFERCESLTEFIAKSKAA
jgi:hypothetical protein